VCVREGRWRTDHCVSRPINHATTGRSRPRGTSAGPLYCASTLSRSEHALRQRQLRLSVRILPRSDIASLQFVPFALLAEDADDTLFRKVTYSSHHLLHTLLPEQTNYPYHLRSRTRSFKLSSQHDERNFIDRMLFKNANSVCTQ